MYNLWEQHEVDSCFWVYIRVCQSPFDGVAEYNTIANVCTDLFFLVDHLAHSISFRLSCVFLYIFREMMSDLSGVEGRVLITVEMTS